VHQVKRLLPLSLAAALIAIAPGRAAAQEDGADDEDEPLESAGETLIGADDLPAGKFGILGALRQNIGELGEQYGWGWLWGFEAGYQPTRRGQALSFGFDWSALFGRSYASQSTLTEDPLLAVEMSLGARLRMALGEEAPRFLVGTAGATILRTSVPIPPDHERLYLGGYVGFGVEQYVGSLLFGLEARFGLLGDGPTGLSLVAGIAFGSL
jgi:hypothetical protein